MDEILKLKFKIWEVVSEAGVVYNASKARNGVHELESDKSFVPDRLDNPGQSKISIPLELHRHPTIINTGNFFCGVFFSKQITNQYYYKLHILLTPKEM